MLIVLQKSKLFLGGFYFFVFLELYVYLFSFVDRVYVSALSILFSLFICFYFIFNIKASIKHWLVYVLSVLFLILSSMISLSFHGGGIWVGSFIKFLIYGVFIFYLTYLSSQRRLGFNFFRLFFYFLSFILMTSLIGGLLLDNFVHLNGRLRFHGLTYTSSLFGAFSGLCFLYFYLYLKYLMGVGYSRTKFYYFCCFMMIVAFCCCALSGSRQPFYGLLLSIFFYYILKNKFYSFFIGSIVTVSLMLYYNELLYSSYFLFLEFLELDSYSFLLLELDGSSYSRWRYFDLGLGYLKDNELLLLGGGLNSFPTVYYLIDGSEKPAAHNFFLMLLMNFGLVGVILFLSLLFYIYRRNRGNYYFVLVIVYFFLGLSLNNPEYFLSVVVVLMLLFFLAVRINLNDCAKVGL